MNNPWTNTYSSVDGLSIIDFCETKSLTANTTEMKENTIFMYNNNYYVKYPVYGLDQLKKKIDSR